MPAGVIREWRDAALLEGGSPHTFTLPSLSTEGVLRFALFSLEANDTEVRYLVRAGERTVVESSVILREKWAEIRVKIAPLQTLDDTYGLRLDSQADVYLATVERFAGSARPANVFIFLIDTLRLDHLGCYGYGRPTSPKIDIFAQDAIVCTQLLPSSSWTRPSVASLLTSTYPEKHGARDWNSVLRKGLPRLTLALSAAGYENHAFITNPSCFPIWGFGTGFSRFEAVGWGKQGWNWDEVAVCEATNALTDTAGRSVFFYVHTMAPHFPYEPPEPFRSRFASDNDSGSAQEVERAKAVDLYDGEIARSDDLFGDFVGRIKDLGLYESSLIILLSDHGEELWDHGKTGHGHTLYEEQLRVPLLIKLPGNRLAGRRYDGLIEMVDIAPTILDILSLEQDPSFQGRSVLPQLEGLAGEERVGYTSLRSGAYRLLAAKTPQKKYLSDLVAGKEYWYDLIADPEEIEPSMEAPSEYAYLMEHAKKMSEDSSRGTHILVVTDPMEPTVVTLSLVSEGMSEYELFYCPLGSETLQQEDELTVSLRMPATCVPEEERLRTGKSYALLEIPDNDSGSFTLSVSVDGENVDPRSVHLGSDDNHAPLTGERIETSSILTLPNYYDPALLSGEFGIYVWYVPEPETISSDEISPEMRDALEALGYLN